MHKFKHRPCYGSSELLIEFTVDGDDADFWSLLLSLFAERSIALVSDKELIHSRLYNFTSNYGSFTIDYDEWGLFFAVSKIDQRALVHLASVLEDSGAFIREPVDSNLYA